MSLTAADLDVERLGSGPTVVLVHGSIVGAERTWRKQRVLSDRWTLLLPNRPRFGNSPGLERGDFEREAPLIAELLGSGRLGTPTCRWRYWRQRAFPSWSRARALLRPGATSWQGRAEESGDGYARGMRIWDLPPEGLCRAHLLGEHRELHAIWSVLTGNRTGYRKHPETLRWEDRLAALYARHAELAEEMSRRGYSHSSPLDAQLATGGSVQDRYVDAPQVQVTILRSKGCNCVF